MQRCVPNTQLVELTADVFELIEKNNDLVHYISAHSRKPNTKQKEAAANNLATLDTVSMQVQQQQSRKT